MKTRYAAIFLLALLLAAPVSVKAENYSCAALADYSSYPTSRKFQTPIIAGREGWLFQTSELAPLPAVSSRTASYLKRFADALKARNTDILFLLIPKRPMIYADKLDTAYNNQLATARYQGWLRAMNDAGIRALDLLTPLALKSQDEPVYFARDYHWNTAGIQAAAKAIDTFTQSASPHFAALPKEAFDTRYKETLPYTGILAEVASKVCGINIPAEELKAYSTQSLAQADLLAEAQPKVILAGTSFSTNKNTNFVGFLQQYLGQSVTNVSVNAGGVDTALLSYLSSGSFEKDSPALILWEVPGNSSSGLNDASFYRQLIPSVKGTCTEATSLAHAETSINSGTTALLHVPASLNIHGHSAYVVLETVEAAPNEFKLHFGYAQGATDTLEIERSTRAKNSGNYYAELSDDIAESLIDVKLEATTTHPVTLRARLCRSE